MPKLISEATGQASELTGERILIRVISAGQGSSGYYPADVLKAAVEAKVFPKGTHMYLDHPSLSEETDRWERSVKDLAAILDEDAYWDEATESIMAQVRVFTPFREWVKDVKEAIGTSIRAYATFEGTTVTELTEALSVDFVTRAGRGGEIVEVLESSKIVSEVLNSTLRERIQSAVNDSYGNEWEAWLRDFDSDGSVAYIYREGKTFAVGYSVSDSGVVSISGEQYEVYPEVVYRRVGTVDESSEEMPVSAVTEGLSAEALADLQRENAELKAAIAERDAAEATQAFEKARDEAIAGAIAESQMPEVAKARVVARVRASIGQEGFTAEAAVEAVEAALAEEAEYIAAIAPAKVEGFGSAGTARESGRPIRNAFTGELITTD